MLKSDFRYEFFLSSLMGLSNMKKLELTAFYKTAERVFKSGEKELLKSGILNIKEAEYLCKEAKSFDFGRYLGLERMGIGYIPFISRDYPDVLYNISDFPYGLFHLGPFPEDFDHAVAIVGARRCTDYGRSLAEEISKLLAKNGALIVSGMARGIDAAGHSGPVSLKVPTVAVLGCGVDVVYPTENLGLYKSIAKTGCIISEYPPGTQPLPHLFPPRNRIISGLSRAVVVVEAAKRSGSLITADQALEQNRDVYASPGRVGDRLCEGTNHLIAQGAGIITSPGDLLTALVEDGIIELKEEKQGKKGVKIRLTGEEKKVFSNVDLEPVGIDELMAQTGFSVPKLLIILEALEEYKLITNLGKNRYSRLFHGK